MMDRIENEYFIWLTALAKKWAHNYGNGKYYNLLIDKLYNTPFVYIIPQDENRASDGENFRLRFTEENSYTYRDAYLYLNHQCNMLEMMAALASRCEQDIMGDEDIGDRTGKWFYQMIINLGLSSMTDDVYDEDYVDFVIDRFMNREYEPNGEGGLFCVKNCGHDLRTMEIWYQMNWYLSEKYR